MQNILVLGAGRSATALISYLLSNSIAEDWHVTVGDHSLDLVQSKTMGHARSTAIKFNIEDEAQRTYEIQKAALVISLLPPHLHQLAAVTCLHYNKHFLTASYVTPEMEALHKSAVKAGILMLNECGLDPGIDHMSAVELINRLQSAHRELLSFKSYTGGLVAPESNDNPWGYKISWNPKNVILAGQSTARYIHEGMYKYIPYHQIFSEIEQITVSGCGTFDGYANRDSLKYRKYYHIDQIPTLIRGTLRQQGYCAAWNVFVQLGLTDDHTVLENSSQLTYADIVRAFLPTKYNSGNLLNDVAEYCGLSPDSKEMEMVEWTGVLEATPTGKENATSAGLLQHLLEDKWKLQPDDKDMVVMVHQFDYLEAGVKKRLESSLVVTGDDANHTAMAKTVGLPLGVVAKLLLNGTIKSRGVCIPVEKDIYVPVLKELEEMGIKFKEKVTSN